MLDNRLERFRDLHKGKKAIGVLGGPSLLSTPIELFPEDFIIFGGNRVYLREGLRLNYLLVGDKQTADQFKDEMKRVDCDGVFTSYGIYSKTFRHKNHYYWEGFGSPSFHTNFHEKIYGGKTVTFVMAQLAYYMGIQELYLVGLDHYWTYDNSDKDGRILTTKGKDKNHFTDDYYGDGIKWFEPIYDEMEKSYHMAREAFEADGRILANASVQTHLSQDVLPRVDIRGVVE